MVRDTVTDGRRVAQLLASELTGQARFGDCAVVDVDPDATPDPDGALAYALECADDRVATVWVYPATARVRLRTAEWPDPEREDLTLADEATLRVERGAAVKPAADALAVALSRR